MVLIALRVRDLCRRSQTVANLASRPQQCIRSDSSKTRDNEANLIKLPILRRRSLFGGRIGSRPASPNCLGGLPQTTSVRHKADK